MSIAAMHSYVLHSRHRPRAHSIASTEVQTAETSPHTGPVKDDLVGEGERSPLTPLSRSHSLSPVTTGCRASASVDLLEDDLLEYASPGSIVRTTAETVLEELQDSDEESHLMVDASPLEGRGRPLTRQVPRSAGVVNNNSGRDQLEAANSFMRTLFANMTPQQVVRFNERQAQIRLLLTADYTNVSADVFNEPAQPRTVTINEHHASTQPVSTQLQRDNATPGPSGVRRSNMSPPCLTTAQKQKGHAAPLPREQSNAPRYDNSEDRDVRQAQIEADRQLAAKLDRRENAELNA
ncbi:hypothetical protein SCHPADRAFT_894735 [Schizopora paradoxa]|uniref:Uncharacterized protein n=1 Tax=Schizopora paradoxa TaxID=27342 RepID=A0A0H2RR83_9AGAM|nr:hypothetical protein SCHPADRAFT_894735 [Schizopora paradoxa]